MNKQQFIQAIRKSGIELGLWQLEINAMQLKPWILGCVQVDKAWQIYRTDGASQPVILYRYKEEEQAFARFFWLVYKHGYWETQIHHTGVEDIMGWNAGYRIMERQVVELYDLGALNKEVLHAIMKPFCNKDLDSGGSENLKSKDGKSAEDIVCFIMEPEKFQKAIEGFIPDPEEPDYNEGLSNLWDEISRKEWNLW